MTKFKNAEEAEKMLIHVPLPERIRRYVPISHLFLIQTITETFELVGYKILEKEYKSEMSGNVMSANFLFESKKGLKTKPLLFFQNSYNKMVPVRIAIGIHEESGSNLLFHEFSFSRKHIGTILKELKTGIEEIAEQFEDLTEKYLEKIQILKIINLNKDEVIEFSGKLIYNDIFNPRMVPKFMDMLKKEFETKKIINTWKLISIISRTLKTLNSRQELTRRLELFTLLTNEFKIY